MLEGALFIRHNNVGDQLIQLKKALSLEPPHENWFRRCIRCNVPLMKAPGRTARDNVPEYVFYENMENIRFCPSCGRYFWPGSHRTRMARQLEQWGFPEPFS